MAKMATSFRFGGRRLILTLLTLALTAYYVVYLWPRQDECAWSSPATANLRGVVQSWLIHQHDNPEQTALDLGAARQQASPSLSPYTEGGALQARRTWLTQAPRVRGFLWPACIYGLLLALLCRRRPRRVALSVSACMLAALILCWRAEPVADLVWPLGHRYFNDYEYLPCLEWDRARPKWQETVIAYEKKPLDVGRRIVALMDGHTESIPEQKFQDLLRGQRDSEDRD
jgi:hypothetical protein